LRRRRSALVFNAWILLLSFIFANLRKSLLKSKQGYFFLNYRSKALQKKESTFFSSFHTTRHNRARSALPVTFFVPRPRACLDLKAVSVRLTLFLLKAKDTLSCDCLF
jgi:ABC-type phosphate/phosphonate transport system permease subunit